VVRAYGERVELPNTGLRAREPMTERGQPLTAPEINGYGTQRSE
jgi:hypothetical protein